METEITDTVSRVCEIKLTEEELAERSQRMNEKKDYELRRLKAKEQELPAMPEKPEEPKKEAVKKQDKKGKAA